jgi:hypothetical protein
LKCLEQTEKWARKYSRRWSIHACFWSKEPRVKSFMYDRTDIDDSRRWSKNFRN